MRKISLLIVALVMGFVLAASGQRVKKMEEPMLRDDPRMLVGWLPNGMTYYIMSNTKPEGRVNFHIVHNVGAVQENDKQLGFAHFLEHMAFNGTKNFQGKEIINSMEAKGISFGRNINAYTSQEETSYMITDVPNRTGLIDTTLLILHDWSRFITLDAQEVEKEKGVIQDELRRRDVSIMRIYEQVMPYYYNNSIYGRRNIIGTMDILRSLNASQIDAFYDKWYRPDLQAIIIVGDIDVDEVEWKIKKIFKDIKKPSNPAAKEVVLIDDYDKDVAKVFTDREQGNTYAEVTMPVGNFELSENRTVPNALENVREGLLADIFNERMSDIANDQDAPFIEASAYVANLVRNRKAFSASVQTKDDGMLEGAERLGLEINRMKRYGVNEDEFQRAKDRAKKRLEQNYANRADRKHTAFTDMAQDNFLEMKPVYDVEETFPLYMSYLDTLSLGYFNSAIGRTITDKNYFVAGITIPSEYEKLSDDMLLKAFQAGMEGEVAPLEGAAVSEQLFDESGIVAGQPVSAARDQFGAYVWEFANGATVVFKQTDFKGDEMLFSSYKKGGLSAVADEDYVNAMILQMFIAMEMDGYGDMGFMEYNKWSAGKNARTSLVFDNDNVKVSGNSSSKDIDLLMQQIHLRYAAPRIEDKELMLYKVNMKTQLANIETNPEIVFVDRMSVAVNGGPDSPRIAPYTKIREELPGATAKELRTIYGNIMNGVNGVEFVFVGAADSLEMVKLASRYIGSLRGGNEDDFGPYDPVRPVKSADDKFIFKRDNDKCTIFMLMMQPYEYNAKNAVTAILLHDILSTRYIETIREEMSATYGVQIGMMFTQEKDFRLAVQIYYDTTDPMAEATSKEIKEELARIGRGEIDAQYLQKAKEKVVNRYEIGQKDNSWWLNTIWNYYGLGVNPYIAGKAFVDQVSQEDMNKMAADIAGKSVVTGVYMFSENIN